MSTLPGTLVLYEAPHRLVGTLSDILEVLGERQVIVARELTKIFEEFIRGSASEVIATVSQDIVRGEVVILIAPGKISPQESEPLENVLRRLMAEGTLSIKDIAKQAALISAVSRSEAYAEALRLKNNPD
jgi:16S rRNA (cytidine1402-2'-O)-methyltransferase